MAVSMVLYETLYGGSEVYIFGGVEQGKAADMVNNAIKAMADACKLMEEGVQGPRGSKTFFGTVVTGTGTGISATVSGSQAGDSYQNTSTFGYYEATAENTWNYIGDLKGPAGISPVATVTKSGGVATITITDATGTTTETISDGFSPTASVSKNGSVATISITDSTGTTTATVSDGVTGWTEGTLVNGSNILSDGASLYSSTAMSGASITVGSSWAVGHTARIGISFASSSTFSYPSGWVCVGDDCSGGTFTFSQGSKYWLTIECKPDATWLFALKVPV